VRNIGKTAAECAESSPIDHLHIVQLADHVLNVCNQCHTYTTAKSTPTIHKSWFLATHHMPIGCGI
jgi:ribosome-binding protein aMBF1 (putative translation factor)